MVKEPCFLVTIGDAFRWVSFYGTIPRVVGGLRPSGRGSCPSFSEDHHVVPHRHDVFLARKSHIRVSLLVVVLELLQPSVVATFDLFMVTITTFHAPNEVVFRYRKDVSI